MGRQIHYYCFKNFTSISKHSVLPKLTPLTAVCNVSDFCVSKIILFYFADLFQLLPFVEKSLLRSLNISGAKEGRDLKRGEGEFATLAYCPSDHLSDTKIFVQ